MALDTHLVAAAEVRMVRAISRGAMGRRGEGHEAGLAVQGAKSGVESEFEVVRKLGRVVSVAAAHGSCRTPSGSGRGAHGGLGANLTRRGAMGRRGEGHEAGLAVQGPTKAESSANSQWYRSRAAS